MSKAIEMTLMAAIEKHPGLDALSMEWLLTGQGEYLPIKMKIRGLMESPFFGAVQNTAGNALAIAAAYKSLNGAGLIISRLCAGWHRHTA